MRSRDLAKVVKEVMEGAYKFRVPIVAETKVGAELARHEMIAANGKREIANRGRPVVAFRQHITMR